jgi:prephenate dehydratase
MKWAFLGPRGTFTEEAATRLADSSQVELVPYPSISEVLEAVSNGTVNRGVVPLENSIEGAVHVTLDAILAHPNLVVQQELVLPVEQNLLTNGKLHLTDIAEVWSHPQALAQCRAFLHPLGVREVVFDSTARAAAALQESRRTDVAAIGTQIAAHLFNLTILRDKIQDVRENDTRFVLVGQQADPLPSSTKQCANKTMLVLTPCREQAGVLASLLNVFAALHLNLSWIESRPTRARLGKYQFFMDIAAGMQAEEMQTALKVIEAYGHSVRVLGTYVSFVNTRENQ